MLDDMPVHSDSPLLRGTSIEDLVSNHLSLPGPPVSLGVCLTELFDKGWNPTPPGCGMQRVAEEAILWMKSFDKSSMPSDNLPEMVVDLLKWYRKISNSTKTVEEKKVFVNKVISNANALVESRFQEAVAASKEYGEGSKESKEFLVQKKELLQTWLWRTVENAKISLEDAKAFHRNVRDTFEQLIQEVVLAAHREYKEQKDIQPLTTRAIKYMEMDVENAHASLDAAMELALIEGDKSSPPVEDDKSKTATDLFMKLQGAIHETLAAGNAPDALKEKLVESVQTMFRSAFEHQPEKNKLPEKEHVEEPSEEKESEEIPVAPVPPSGEKPLEENKSSKPLEKEAGDMPPPAAPSSAGQRALAAKREMVRKDTSELEKEAMIADQVVMEDGTIMYRHKGELETLAERETRLAKNSYMRFSRSFQGTLRN